MPSDSNKPGPEGGGNPEKKPEAEEKKQRRSPVESEKALMETVKGHFEDFIKSYDKKNYRDADIFLKFLDYLSEKGISDALSVLQDVCGGQVTWQYIKDYNISFWGMMKKLIDDNVKNKIGPKVEKALVKAMVKKIHRNTDFFVRTGKNRAQFEAEFINGNYNPGGLDISIDSLDNLDKAFQHYWGNIDYVDQINLQELKSISISNSDILQELIATGVIKEKDRNQITGEHLNLAGQELDPSIKGVLNNVLSLQVMDTFYNSANKVKAVADSMKKYYRIPGMSSLIDKVDKSIKSDPARKAEFDALEIKRDDSPDEIQRKEKEQYRLFKSYVMADSTYELHDFFNRIGDLDEYNYQDWNRDKLIKQTYLDILRNKWFDEDHITGEMEQLFGTKPENYKTFLDKLFNLDENDLDLPCGTVKIKKDIKFFHEDEGDIDRDKDGAVRYIKSLNDFKKLGVNFVFDVFVEEGDEKVDDFFKTNFSENYVDFAGKKFYNGQKVRVSTKDGQVYEGYTEIDLDYTVKRDKDGNIEYETEPEQTDENGKVIEEAQSVPKKGEKKLHIRLYDTTDELSKKLVVDQGFCEDDFVGRGGRDEFEFNESYEENGEVGPGKYKKIRLSGKGEDLKDNQISRLIYLNNAHNAFSETLADDEQKKLVKEAADKRVGQIADSIQKDKEDDEKTQDEETEKPVQEFVTQLKNLDGDSELDFETFEELKKNGPINLFVRLDESFVLGGGTNWLKIKFFDYDDTKDPPMFKMSIHGTEIDIGSFEGKTYEREMNGNIIAQLRQKSYGEILKFKNINNKDLFFDYAEKLIMKSEVKNIKAGLGAWRGLKKDGEKILDSDGYEVQYIGKIDKAKVEEDGEKKEVDYALSFKVKFQEDGVVVQRIEKGDKYVRKMDYSSFLVFVTEKGLSPLSEKKKKDNVEYAGREEVKPNNPTTALSLGVIMGFGKLWLDNFKAKMKEVDEMRQVRFYAKMVGSEAFGALGDIVGFATFGLLKEPFSELNIEATGELDKKIMGLIDSHKDRLSRDESVSDANISGIIEEQIFKGGNLAKSNPYKSAGYLLCAIEKGGPYFRKLSKYAGKGLWVEKILGKEAKETYLKELNKKYGELNDMEKGHGPKLDEIMRFEVWFIKDKVGKPQFHSVFGSQFVGKLDGAFTSLVSKEKSYEKQEKTEKKSNFSDIYDDFESAFNNNKATDALGVLGAMSKKMVDEKNYRTRFAAMTACIVSGYAYHSNGWSNDQLKVYHKLSATNGFALGYYIRDKKGPEKIVYIIDHVCDIKNITPKFSEAINWEKRKPYIERHGNYGENNDSYKDFLKDINKWFDKEGSTAMKTLNLQDITEDNNLLTSIDKKEGENLDVLKDYIDNKVVTDTDENDERGIDKRFLKPGGVQFDHSLLCTPEEMMKDILLNYRGGRLFESGAEDIWKQLEATSSKLVGKGKMNKTVFGFIFKKYFAWFKTSYTDEKKFEFRKDIKKAKEMTKFGTKEKRTVIDKYILKTLTERTDLPRIVINTVRNFVDIFVNNFDYLDDDELQKGAFGFDPKKYVPLTFKSENRYQNRRSEDDDMYDEMWENAA